MNDDVSIYVGTFDAEDFVCNRLVRSMPLVGDQIEIIPGNTVERRRLDLRSEGIGDMPVFVRIVAVRWRESANERFWLHPCLCVGRL